jgi:4-amino-4-deoxy-L-arabinose transferase-like glycosyltransferase
MTKGLLEDRRMLWIVAGITILLFLIANLPWQLDDSDQAKQAFTSFEMIKEGRWFYQRTPHEHVATKPPLIGWISAGLFALTRSWDVAWRLPSFLAAIGLSIFLFSSATSAYGTSAGAIALGAFGFNLLSPRLATLVRTDMPLAFVIFLIGLLIWRKIQKEEPWRSRDRFYIFALLTAAMLIKGPIVYAFLLPGIALFQWRAVAVAGAVTPARVAERSKTALALGATGGRGSRRWLFFSYGWSAESFFSPVSSMKLSCANSWRALVKRSIGRNRFIFICRICCTNLLRGAR